MGRLEDQPEVGPVRPGFIGVSISGFAIALVGGVVELADNTDIFNYHTSADRALTRGLIGAGLTLGLGSLIAGLMLRPQKRS
jgi:hypothetical protein